MFRGHSLGTLHIESTRDPEKHPGNADQYIERVRQREAISLMSVNRCSIDALFNDIKATVLMEANEEEASSEVSRLPSKNRNEKQLSSVA